MKQKPFFAKFLENQLQESTSGEVKGGDCCPPDIQTTLKNPSDMEEDIPMATHKAPSDCEEGSPFTLKYPSDWEEC
jgi:hypothetical protein